MKTEEGLEQYALSIAALNMTLTQKITVAYKQGHLDVYLHLNQKLNDTITKVLAGKSMKDKLKPCPFCGNKAAEVRVYRTYTYFFCAVCGANSGKCQTKKEALAAWNKRVKYLSEFDCDSVEKFQDGSCIGYGMSETDDEPCEQCKTCEKYQSYGEE
jgi:Lar family restriction alleviation protein